jgi:Tol biopolymer transport system component
VPWWLAALAAAAVAVALMWWVVGLMRGAPAPPLATEFLVPPPAADQLFAPMPLPGLLPTAPQVGLSPDGRRLAFVASDADGTRRLWIRSMDNSRPRAVDGTDGAGSWPFWSPDSRYAVIAAGRTLVKVDTANHTVERLCTLPEATPSVPFVTGSWNAGGTILFSIGGSNPIYRTTSAGGPPQPATLLDTARGDQYHSWPQLLDDRRFLLFVRTDGADTNGVYAGTLGTDAVVLVRANPSRAVYANEYLLWTTEDRLVAQRFDASSLRLEGQPATVVPSVFVGAGRTPGFWMSNASGLVYAAGDTRERQFHSFGRDGAELGTVGPPGLYVTFDTNADLSRVVVEVSRDIEARFATLALFDAARGVLAPLTLGNQHDSDPRFGAAGEVVFARNAGDAPGITRIDPASRGASTLRPRGAASVVWLEDWSPDGDSGVYRSSANRDAWYLPGDSAEPRRLTEAREPVEQVQLSPDRRWIVYNTAETGRSEVFVSSVSAGGERRQVSAAGGVQPTWRADGRELYFLSLDGALYAVDVASDGTSVRTGVPRLLFRTPLPVISAVVEQYRPSGDGQRFLLCLPLTSVRREPLRVLLNWQARLTNSR